MIEKLEKFFYLNLGMIKYVNGDKYEGDWVNNIK